MSKRVCTPEEEAFILANYSKLSFLEIAASLGRNWHFVQYHCARLIKQGLLNPRDRRYAPRWTPDEVEWLMEHYGHVSDAYIRHKLRRTKTAILLKTRRLGITKKQNMFTMQELGRLFRVDAKTVRRWIDQGLLQARQLAWKIGRNRPWCITAEDLEEFMKYHTDRYDYRRIDFALWPYWYNLARWASGELTTRVLPEPFTPEEDAFLVEHYATKGAAWIGEQLGRAKVSVISRAEKLRAKGVPVPRMPRLVRQSRDSTWQTGEDQFLRENWGYLSGKEMGFILGRTADACSNRARVLGCGLPAGVSAITHHKRQIANASYQESVA